MGKLIPKKETGSKPISEMQPSGDEAQLLTPKELAQRLKVCESTVYREQRDGRMPGRMVRGKLRFFWPEVLRALPAAPVTVGIDVIRPGESNPDLVVLLKNRVRAGNWLVGRK